MADVSGGAGTAARMRVVTVALDLALIALVMAWQFTAGWSVTRFALGLVLTLPLWAPLPGLWRANRRTFACTTLCVIPYFVIGITETVARPGARAWTGMCLVLALTLFVTLIVYLRITRDTLATSVGSED